MPQTNSTPHPRDKEAANHQLVVSALRFGRLPLSSVEACYLLVAAEALSGRPDDRLRLHNLAVEFFARLNRPVPSLPEALKKASITDLPRLRNLLDFRLTHLDVAE